MPDSVIITPAQLCTVEVVPTVTTNVEVIDGDVFNIELKQEPPVIVDFGLTNIGLRGPQGIPGPVGPAGPSTIGGYPVVTDDIQDYDVLQFKSAAWRNNPQEALTDGGNF